MNHTVISDIIINFINSFPRIDITPNRFNSSLKQYLLEHRTLVLGLPRQTGKTVTAQKIATMLPGSCLIVHSIMVKPKHPVDYDVYCMTELKYISSRGKSAPASYQYVILDECFNDDQLFDVNGFGQLLDRDTIIISVGTPT